VTRPESFSFDPDAANDTAASLYRLALARGATVLHLGTGCEAVAQALSTLDAVKVTQVVTHQGAFEARATAGPEIFVADPAAAGWYAALDGRTYDVVIVADLLEQLSDPARLLRDLREQRLLAEDGRLLISFANVAHPVVMNELLSGVSSRIRWYTASSMNRLLSASGYLSTETHRTHRPTDRQATTGAGDDAQTYEYILQAQPSAAGPQVALLHDQLDDANQRLAEAEAGRDQINALLLEERAAFQEEIARGADELEQLQAQLARRTDELSSLRREIVELHRQLARVQDELAVASDAKQDADHRLATIQNSRSYRWSRRLAKTANVVVAPLRSGRRRAQGGR
jgi:Methyltransferase domain